METKAKPKRKKIPSVFGLELERIMRQRSYTYRQIAEMAGVSVSVVGSWVGKDAAVPHDLSKVKQLSVRLGVSFHQLLLGEPPPASEVSITEIFDEVVDERLSGIWKIEARKLSPRKR